MYYAPTQSANQQVKPTATRNVQRRQRLNLFAL